MSAAAIIGFAGCVAVTHTTAYQIRSSNSDVAHRLAPYDGRLTALAAAFRAGPDATSADRRQADDLAREALRKDATAVVAASTLGLDTQVSNDKKAARRFFAYAETLSRRDIQTQLWAIEDAVGRDDIAGALRHYDTALRVTPSLSQMLFPVLSAASTDPQIRAPLIRTLATNPPWGEGLVVHIAGNGPDPRSSAQLLANLRKAGVATPDAAQVGIINSLTTAGFIDDAWNYYALLHPGADRRKSRDPRFMGNLETSTPFDWTIGTTTGVSASIQRGERQGIFDFAAPAMIGGMLLQQTQLLPPGSYKLSGHSIDIEQAATARPYWRLTCQDGRELGRVPVTNSSDTGGSFSGTFNVPQGCSIQILSLIAQPSEAMTGVSGQIDFVLLSPSQPGQ